MNIIIILIGVSLSVALGFLALFIWNLRSGQYDDVETPSIRMLFENKVESRNKSPDPEHDKSQVSG